MASADDAECRGRDVHLGHFAFDLHGIARAGDQIVHGDDHLDQLQQRRQLRPQHVGEIAKHAQRLALSSTSASRSALPSSMASEGSMKRVPRTARLVVNDPRRD